MVAYNFRVVDTQTGKQLGACDGLPSPHDVGRVAADAYVVLTVRDGHHPDHLALEGVVVEDDQVRDFTIAEEAAMVAALDQFMAEVNGNHRAD